MLVLACSTAGAGCASRANRPGPPGAPTPQAPASAPAAAAAPAAGPPPAAAEPAAAPPRPPGGALGELDRLFFEAYNARRERWRPDGPVIVISAAKLFLHRGPGAPQEAHVIPDVYHALKAVAHLPFAVYLRLVSHTSASSLPDDVRSALPVFLARITASRAAVTQFGLNPEQVARQHTLLDTSERFVADVLRAGAVRADALQQFAAKLGPVMLTSANEAACAQIEQTHTQVMAWKGAMSDEEWRRLVVVNQSGHQPRYRNVNTQYFAWLFKDSAPAWAYPGESLRLIYAESMRAQQGPLDLLAAIDIDAQAAAAFFGDKWRLSEDLLSEGAAACLKTLTPPPAASGQ